MPSSVDPPAGSIETQVDGSSMLTNCDVHSLSWQDLIVTVKNRETGHNKDILSGVSGIAYPGDLIALMGPSGSGKTTLLSTLAQRQTANVLGKVLVNGQERSLVTHRAISSFVEQEDTLIGSLTVEETLRFVARLALPRSVSKADQHARVSGLIDALGLSGQRHTLIGTPIQKGISGGQKRRVSVAAQLITGPQVLYLDEPTSGLDATASFEVMSLIREIAIKHNLIVIASIHQPSTKTFNLFSKVMLLSQGKTCYFGPIPELMSFLTDIGHPVPDHTNPAEYVLDLTNMDFDERKTEKTNVDVIHRGWEASLYAQQLEAMLSAVKPAELRSRAARSKPNFFAQTATLLHRSLIKSFRDIVVYWIRVAMYLGLAIMMGTVWLRLSTSQNNIQSFVNAIFFGSAFMSFMAVAYVPAFLEDRASFIKERSNGLYGPAAFLVSNFLIGLPFLFLISLLFSVVAYWLINLQPTAVAFFTWVMWLFLDLLAAESLVVLVSSVVPNFVIALALIAFPNGLWMSVGGFLVAVPGLNVFWRYVFHYIDYQAYVFQGMMVNEFKSRIYSCSRSEGAGSCYCMYPSALQDKCQIPGTAVLGQYGYAEGREGKWVGILIGIIAVYRIFGWVVTVWKKS